MEWLAEGRFEQRGCGVVGFMFLGRVWGSEKQVKVSSMFSSA